MRILHYVQRLLLEKGGTVRAAIDLTTALARAGHDVRVLTYNTTDTPDGWNTPGYPQTITITEPRGPTGGFSGPQLLEIADHLRWAKGDQDTPGGRGVVHLHSMWQPTNAQLARACRQLHIPYVISVHGMLDDWSMAQKRLKKRLYWRFAERNVLEGASFVHCTAQAELDQASKWLGKGRGLVLPLVFDTAPFIDAPGPELARDAFDLDPQRNHVLFLSRIHPKKGLDVLVRALAQPAMNDCTLLIGGTGDPADERAIDDLVAQLGVADRVKRLGLVTGDTKLSLYRAADVFALPTQQENFGMVFFEALASAAPVVTTDQIDTTQELVASGGALIADRTPEAFARAVGSLLADPARREEMGRSGRAWVLEHLDPARIVAAYAEAYASAADTHPAG